MGQSRASGALAIGSTFGGRYRIDRELGAGGMGHVYAAQDTLLRRPVALKIVKADDDDEEVAKERSARLLREARAVAALRHPNAVQVFDVGESAEGVPFIAMELVTGRTLGAFMRSDSTNNIASVQKLGWLLGIARALAAAHKEGIVHRDIKPENIMICDDGASVKVLDFGIAKRANQNSSTAGHHQASDGPPSFKTAEGVVTGTPRYMAPEQLIGGTLDGRTDQFAWGILAYELLAGIHPQTTTGSAERWAAPPQALTKIAPAAVKEAISQIVMRSLERWPEHRWSSMDDLVRALEAEVGAQVTMPMPMPMPMPAIAATAAAAVAEPTMRFDTYGVPIPNPSATTAGFIPPSPAPVPLPSTAMDAPLLPKTITGARVLDVHRPAWRRLIVPLIGLGFMFLGLIDMLRVVVAQGGEHAPELGKALLRVGWIIIFLSPLTLLLRRLRVATLLARSARLSITGARGMNQSLSPSDVVGASAAMLPDGSGASVLIMPKRSGTSPIILTSFSEVQGQSILAALGITHARALTGILSFPLRRGAFDIFRLVIAIVWRTGIVLTYAPITIVYLIGFAVSVLTGLIAIGLVFAPLTGPHLELTPEQLRVIGSDDRVLALRDLVECVATESSIELRLRSGDTLRLHAPKPLFSRRSMSMEERTHLVAHVNAAVARARAAWS